MIYHNFIEAVEKLVNGECFAIQEERNIAKIILKNGVLEWEKSGSTPSPERILIAEDVLSKKWLCHSERTLLILELSKRYDPCI